LTPKPGLVDRRGAGAHIDLSLANHEAFRLSDRTVPLPKWRLSPAEVILASRWRELLAVIGRDAERAMLKATSGKVTRIRAQFGSWGLLISASAMQDDKGAGLGNYCNCQDDRIL